MRKKPFSLLVIIALILAILGGVLYYMNHQKEEETTRKIAEEENWEKQKPRIETFFRYNFNDIKTIDYTETIHSPMDIGIRGYVNGDTKLSFTATVTGFESEFNEHTTVSKDLGQLRKDRTSYITVDEIEKEQQEND